MVAVTVRAPISGFIKDIVTPGEVDVGDKLATIESPATEAALNRISLMISDHDSSDFEISDEYIERQRQLISDAIEVARSYESYLQEVSDDVERRENEGQATMLEVRQYRAELEEAKAKTRKMRNLKKSFEQMASYGKSSFGVARDLLVSQKQVIEKYKSASNVVCSIAGTAEPRIMVGGFVSEGDVIAIVTFG